MKKVILSILLIMGMKSFGQIDQASRVLSSSPGISATLRANNVFDPNKNNNTIEGTPYSTENFQNGRIDGINATIVFKYNANRDVIEFKDGEKFYELPKDKAYSPIILQNSTKIVLDNNKDGSLTYYLELFNNNDTSLLRRDKINLIEAKESDGYRDAVPPKFSSLKSEYFLKQNGNISEFPKNKKALNELVKSNENIDNFVKKNSSYIKNENQLIELTKIISNSK